MLLTLGTLACLICVQVPDKAGAPRERHPLAPSLPLLTEKESAAIDAVIDRFIAFDTGKLKGQEALKAVADFKALGPEAIPNLIDGLNRAADMQDSCPAVLIAKKLGSLLNGSRDLKLLDFARENIGAGVTAKRHVNVLKDLKVSILLRKSAVQRAGLQEKEAGPKQPKSMTTAELVEAAGGERGARLTGVLTELEKRSGDKVLPTLAFAAEHYDAEVSKLGRSLLQNYLSRQPAAALKKSLEDERKSVRATAARAAGGKGPAFAESLIRLLADLDPDVVQAARQALVQLSKGQDFGPPRDAEEVTVRDSVRQWRAWWERQKK